MTMLHAGGKFESNAYKVSGGLHGVGVTCVNALAEWMKVEVYRDGQGLGAALRLRARRPARSPPWATQRRGTKITFKPDATIFETTEFSFETLSGRLRELAFLNAGLKITIEDERSGKKHEFLFKDGIREFVAYLNKSRVVLLKPPIALRQEVETERGTAVVEIALQWNDAYDETVFAFANNIHNHEGGTHLIGFKAALTRTINAYGTKNNLFKDLKDELPSGDDMREGLAAVISIACPARASRGRPRPSSPTPRRRAWSRPWSTSGWAIPGGEPERRQADLRQGGRGGPRPRSRPQGARDRPPQGRARRRRRSRGSSPTARSATRRSARSSWSRATPPAAPPSRGATGASRRSCRCAARS